MFEKVQVAKLIYWMEERHNIYLKRAAGEKWPWTEDKILQEYRFCNVFRELDTVTEWIRTKWREPYADHPNLWFAMCVARQINWPETLEEIGFPAGDWNEYKHHAIKVMIDRKRRGEKVYTGAYMIRADFGTKEKAEYTCNVVLSQPWAKRKEFEALDQSTLQDTNDWFNQFHGWGGFMSYEVVTDLRHTRYLCDAPDIMTWANAGPGAKRGLNRLLGRELMKPMKQSEACELMKELLEIVQKDVNSRQCSLNGLELEMRDIEHSLCETDKYQRVLLNEGRPRSKYSAPEEK